MGLDCSFRLLMSVYDRQLAYRIHRSSAVSPGVTKITGKFGIALPLSGLRRFCGTDEVSGIGVGSAHELGVGNGERVRFGGYCQLSVSKS